MACVGECKRRKVESCGEREAACGTNTDTPVKAFFRECFSAPNRSITALVFGFVEPLEVISSLLFVSKRWNWVILNSPVLDRNERRFGIMSRVLFDRSGLLSRRRAKGNVYRAKYLCSSGRNERCYEDVVLRVVNVRTTNGESEDGIPSYCLREISNLQRTRHPRVVGYYGSQLIGVSLYIVTEFVEHDLSSFIERKHSEYKSLGRCVGAIRNEIMELMNDLLRTVALVHSRSVFHRNLKPENIFVQCEVEVVESCLRYRYGGLKLGDLGMGRSTHLANYTPEDPKERHRSVRESRRLHYRAPEIVMRSKSYGKSCDLWTLGVIFFELASSSTLFQAQNELSLIWDVFRLKGFPGSWGHSNVSPSVYRRWEGITIPYEPVDREHIVLSTKRLGVD